MPSFVGTTTSQVARARLCGPGLKAPTAQSRPNEELAACRSFTAYAQKVSDALNSSKWQEIPATFQTSNLEMRFASSNAPTPASQSVSNAYEIGSRSKCRDRGRHPCSRRRLRGGSSLSPGPTLGEGDDVSGNSFHDQTPAGKRNFPSRDKPAQLATAHDIERGETLPLVGESGASHIE